MNCEQLIRHYYGRAASFDLAQVIDAYLATHQVSRDLAELQADELKRFMCIRAAVDRSGEDGVFRIGMTGSVDDFWHIFLLFSPLYVRFCNAVFGFFIHHQPNPPLMSPAETAARLLNFVNGYELAFGHEPSGPLWPDRQAILARHGFNFLNPADFAGIPPGDIEASMLAMPSAGATTIRAQSAPE